MPFNLLFPVPPEFIIPLSEVTCETGETIVLRCKVCGRPKASVTWKGPDHNTLSNDGHHSISYRYSNLCDAQQELLTLLYFLFAPLVQDNFCL